MRLSFRVFLGYVAIIVPVIIASWIMGIAVPQIAIITLVAAIAALIASSILMYMLGRPIQELRRGVQRIAEGKFTSIQLQQAPSDLVALAGTFNQMVESLKGRDDQLQALNDELSRRLRELNALYEVSRSVNSSLDIQEVLRAILNETVKTFPTAQKGLIHLIDESGKRLIPIALSDTSRPLDPSMGMPIDQGIAGRVVRTRKPVTLSDTAQDPDFIDLGSNVRSLMVVPLMVGDNVIGALSLDSTTRNSFTSDMEEVFQSLANRAVIALENARLYSDSQKRVKELTSLYNSALSLSGEQSPDSLHEQLVQRATELLEAHSATLFLADHTLRTLKVVSSFNTAHEGAKLAYRFGEGVAGQVAQTAEPLIANALPADAGNGSTGTEAEGSLIAVPLIWENEVLGVLQIARRANQHGFEPADTRLLTLFAQQGASALENARLLSNQRRRTRQLALLNDLNRRFAAILNADMLMKEAVQGVAERFGYAIVNIGLLEGDWFVMKASSNPEASSLHSGTQRIGQEGIIGHVAATGQPYVANDVLSDPHYLSVFPDTQSELAVPILGKDGVLGVLDIQERHHNAFINNDVSIMQNLAVQLGIAIDNAHLFHAAQQRAEQLTKILEVTQDLRRQQQLELMLQKITDIVQQTLGWRTVLLAMLDLSTGTSAPVAVATDDEGLRESILLMPPRPASNAHWEEEQYRISQSYFVRGEELSYPEGDERLVRTEMGERKPWEWQSDDLLVIPIIGYTGPLGHLSVDDPVDRQRPTLEKIQVLEIFAHQAASAIEDARLIEELHLKTDALEEANKGLSRASQMKSEFLANMSHE
nr:GAF domain-containing protein [Ardenticatenales bacterium]